MKRHPGKKYGKGKERKCKITVRNAEGPSTSDRAARSTAYARERGAFTHDNRCAWWWIRNEGADPHYARYVNCLGDILEYGTLVFSSSFGVRPAVWVETD